MVLGVRRPSFSAFDLRGEPKIILNSSFDFVSDIFFLLIFIDDCLSLLALTGAATAFSLSHLTLLTTVCRHLFKVLLQLLSSFVRIISTDTVFRWLECIRSNQSKPSLGSQDLFHSCQQGQVNIRYCCSCEE